MSEPKFTPSRRALMLGTAWSVPAIVAAGSVPAFAASVPQCAPGALSVTVTAPTFSWETFEPVRDVAVYAGRTSTRVRTWENLPPSVVLRNGSGAAVSGCEFYMELAMQDYTSDYTPIGRNQVKMASGSPDVTATEIPTPATSGDAGSLWRLTVSATIPAGQTLTMPIRYWIQPIMTNVAFQLLVQARTTTSDFHNPINNVGNQPDLSSQVGYFRQISMSVNGRT